MAKMILHRGSNRPDLIDPALLWPGRFDKLPYVGVSSDASYREWVLEALTCKLTLHQDVSLNSIAKKRPPKLHWSRIVCLVCSWLVSCCKAKGCVQIQNLHPPPLI